MGIVRGLDMHNTIDRYPFFITQLMVAGARQFFLQP